MAYTEHAAGHGVVFRVLGNKVTDADGDYLRREIGTGLLGWLTQSPGSARPNAASPARPPKLS